MRTMAKHAVLLLATAVLLAWCERPAWSQDLPDGPGKEQVAALCNSPAYDALYAYCRSKVK